LHAGHAVTAIGFGQRITAFENIAGIAARIGIWHIRLRIVVARGGIADARHAHVFVGYLHALVGLGLTALLCRAG
jgi:hypothetical protein